MPFTKIGNGKRKAKGEIVEVILIGGGGIICEVSDNLKCQWNIQLGMSIRQQTGNSLLS